ncbi:UNVERIFIED_CONTAM: hypothetical protein FKN15_028602 [Acipenser sinensis]
MTCVTRCAIASLHSSRRACVCVDDKVTPSHPPDDAPTSPPERSEHFKPCRDKDLAYCLNEGECFVIETLTGSHKHCRSVQLSVTQTSTSTPLISLRLPQTEDQSPLSHAELDRFA